MMKKLVIALAILVTVILLSSKNFIPKAAAYEDPVIRTNRLVNEDYQKEEYKPILDSYNKVMEGKVVKSPYPYYVRALLKQKLKDFDGSEADFNKAIELANEVGFTPTETTVYIAKAQMLFDKKDYNSAIEVYKETLKTPSNDFYSCPTLVSIGEAYRYLNNYELADEYYAKALDKNSMYEPALHSRGYLKILQKDYQGAVVDFTEALKYVQNPYSYAHRGFAYIQMGDLKQANVDLQKALKQLPNSKVALYYTSYYWSKSGKPQKAQAYLKQADESSIIPEVYAHNLGMLSNQYVMILEAWLASRIADADKYAAKYARGELKD